MYYLKLGGLLVVTFVLSVLIRLAPPSFLLLFAFLFAVGLLLGMLLLSGSKKGKFAPTLDRAVTMASAAMVLGSFAFLTLPEPRIAMVLTTLSGLSLGMSIQLSNVASLLPSRQGR